MYQFCAMQYVSISYKQIKKCAEQSWSAHRKVQTPIVVTQNFTKKEFLIHPVNWNLHFYQFNTGCTKGYNSPYKI